MDQHDGQRQLELDVAHRGADGGGAVGEHAHLGRRRQRVLELGQQRLDAVDDRDDVGAGLALHVEDDGGIAVHPGADLGVLRPLRHRSDVGKQHRRPVLVGDDDGVVVVRALDLIVGVDRVGALRPVEIALGRVDVGVGDGGAQVVDVEAVAGELAQVRLDAHRRSLPAGDADEADARQLRDLLREPCVGEVLELRQRDRLRGDTQGQDRRVGGIDLGVDRRRRQVGGQQVAGGVDRGLHFLLGDIEAEREAELQGNHRSARRALRGHLAEAGHLPELALERRRHRGGHHVRAGAGIKRLHLDGGVVDLRQRRERQEGVADHAYQHDRQHEQRRRHRPQDEDTRGTHGGAADTPPRAPFIDWLASLVPRARRRRARRQCRPGRAASPWRPRAACRRRRSRPGRRA